MKITNIVEHTLWGVTGLFLLMIIGFAILHVLRTSSLTSSNLVGSTANWIGSHAQNY